MKLIGLSLSNCIKDILDGKVDLDDVKNIIARTKAETNADWVFILDVYENMYWNNDGAGTAVALFLKAEERIQQPRLLDKKEPIPSRTRCRTIDQEMNWVQSMEDIVWINNFENG